MYRDSVPSQNPFPQILNERTPLPQLLAAEEAGLANRPKAKSVIFLFLFGGPSQLETFDLKPG
ncbi:MAG: DUF1501 domain-containing protein, partial [Planctomycetota bacterium]